MNQYVVHCKHSKYDIYIGRPSQWGNPFSHHEKKTLAKYKVDSREDAVKKYEKWIMTQPQLLKNVKELKNKILGCWCAPEPCHGDVLARLANE